MEISVDSVEIEVKKLISKQLGKPVSQLNNQKSFKEDLGADSLDAVSLLLALEDELGIEISDDVGTKILTVQDAIDFAARHYKP